MNRVINSLRRNAAFNAIVRTVLLKVKGFVEWMIPYWPVSGTIKYHFNDIILKLHAEADDSLTSKLFYQQKWETHVLQWFAYFCRNSRVIVDAGANIGLFSLLANKINPLAEIHAFEPNPNNVNRLIQNINLNKAGGRVKVQPFALGATEGEVKFYLPSDRRISDVSSIYESHTKSFNNFEHIAIPIRSVSLDIFYLNRSAKIGLVKIDVELYELQVLKGMKEILSNDRPVVFCEIFNDEIKKKQNPMLKLEIQDGYSMEITNFLKDLGYHFYSITVDGLIEVFDFYYSPMSSMYLLLPQRLSQRFYAYDDRYNLEKEL